MSIFKFIKNLFSSKKQAEMPVTIDLNLKNKEVYPPLENKSSESVEAPVEVVSETPVVHEEVMQAPVVPQITDAVTTEKPAEQPKKTAKEIKAKAKKEIPATEEKPKSKPKPKNK